MLNCLSAYAARGLLEPGVGQCEVCLRIAGSLRTPLSKESSAEAALSGARPAENDERRATRAKVNAAALSLMDVPTSTTCVAACHSLVYESLVPATAVGWAPLDPSAQRG